MGLSGRNFDKNNYRMVFVFESPQRVDFWMKNTKIDLSIAFIDKNINGILLGCRFFIISFVNYLA